MFLMLTLIIFWGGSFVVVSALENSLSPIAIATFRFLIAGAIFLVALLLKKSREHDYRLLVEKKDTPTFLLLALSGVTFFFATQYTGIKMAGPSIAAILVCLLSPILIGVFSAKIFKENLAKRQILGICIAATGTVIVVIGSTLSFPENPNFFLGSLILLATPVLWASYSLLGKRVMEKYDPFLAVAYVNILGGLLLTPISLAENSFYLIFSISTYSWLAILFLSITCSFLGYSIWFYVLKREKAAATSSFLFAEPLITVIFAIAFTGEKISLFTPIGGLLTFIGVYQVTNNRQ